jgi:hypothetical protein
VTVIVTGALELAFGWAKRKSGLFVALVVVAAGLYFSNRITDRKAVVVAFFNAFLVYMTAAGVSAFAGSVVEKTTRGLTRSVEEKPNRGETGHMFGEWFARQRAQQS